MRQQQHMKMTMKKEEQTTGRSTKSFRIDGDQNPLGFPVVHGRKYKMNETKNCRALSAGK